MSGASDAAACLLENDFIAIIDPSDERKHLRRPSVSIWRITEAKNFLRNSDYQGDFRGAFCVEPGIALLEATNGLTGYANELADILER